jgi:arylsulfatase A-like enzyme
MRELSAMQFDLRTPWDSVRHDYITVELAFEYLKHVKPRVLYMALGEPDDWAHDKRYDRALEAIHYLDRVLERLWNQIESMSEYSGVTSIVLTTDHGRGPDLENWHSHGTKVEGAEQIWIAAMGPDTPPAGEAVAAVHQRDVAATMLALMGVDPTTMPGMAGKPIALLLGR